MRIICGRVVGCQDIPLRSLQITLLDSRSAIAMGFYGGPDLLVGELFDTGELSGLLEGLDDECDLAGGTYVFEESPAVRD
ncbi:hypothetical protein ABB55_14225 [Prosthecomicrobium hirschii]|uniref:Uncharacterized protein n=1 Tax=Prosthecodimorpha hirschii TaxID=665126 RepID=A0A0P6W467_9HYPH|nr:hypothetical protein ABB55_14225 [Prosthecomicrobium hirschii]